MRDTEKEATEAWNRIKLVDPPKPREIWILHLDLACEAEDVRPRYGYPGADADGNDRYARFREVLDE